MALTVVASSIVNKGEWTNLYTTTSPNENLVVSCPLFPINRPVPCLWIADAFEDVLDTNRVIVASSVVMAASAQFIFKPVTPSDIWVYYELSAPFGAVIPVSVWLYS